VPGRRELNERHDVRSVVAEGGSEPVHAGQPADLLQGRGRVGRLYPPRVGQVRQPQAGSPGQRVIAREHDRDARLADAHGGQRRELRERIARGGEAIGQADVELAACDLGRFDAIWLVPGSPYDNPDGAIAAVRTARERRIPFLGTCGGFQYALLEFARNVCGLPAVENAEVTPEADEHLIVQLECSLKGHEEAVMIVPGSHAAEISGPGRRTERYHCDYGLNAAYLERLSQAGLRFSGFDDNGQVRIAELPGHPFFVGTLFQPELHGDGSQPHPIIAAMAAAASRHATATTGAAALAG